MPIWLQTTLLLVLSNIFMTFAWYGHLRDLNHKPWFIAALVSWGIAFFEYAVQVPANRIGYTEMRLPQLKILQEVITLTVFVPFSLYYMRQPLRLDYLWSALCMCGAVYFVFRDAGGQPTPTEPVPVQSQPATRSTLAKPTSHESAGPVR